jgi:hypothetical protein
MTQHRFTRRTTAAAFALLASSAVSASAQQSAVDPSTSPADDPVGAPGDDESFRFHGRGVYAGAGPGLMPQVGEGALATRVNFVFPVATDWLGIEVGLLGQSFTAADHHDEDISINAGAITTGARFRFAPDAAISPYGSARLAHIHFFPDPYADHVHHRDGSADHESNHLRWGAGGALGLEAGIPEPTSRFRVALEAEAIAFSGNGVNVLGQIVALVGIGF